MPRKTAKLRAHKTILLVVEGETEQIYFSQVRADRKISGITIVPRLAKHSSVKHILKTALTEYEEHIYDEIWCVFDRDTIVRDGLSEETTDMLEEAKNLGIKFAQSYPSFEVWFYLHFALPQPHYLSQFSLIEDFRQFVPRYGKEQAWLACGDLYAKLKPREKDALINSEELRTRNEATPSEGNTACDVDILMRSAFG
ncbi:MAG: RloB domain-containing protein [Treponema sp.]|nr:RloB domain-containing protein [Treponema sp.]